jgi:ABC-type protease/lipase transport system fused ATPase/permease subunit
MSGKMNIKKIFGYSFMICLVAMLGMAPLVSAAMKSDQTSAAEVRQETENLLKTLKSYTIEQRDEAVRKTAEVLEKLDKRIDAQEKWLDENWAKMDQAARESARASLKELHRQRNQVAEWYGSMKSSSGEAWEHMKTGFSEAFKSLQKAWEKSEKEFSADK